ncbi:hypothetical protein BDV59DRAFT_187905 [Aspergillus ambiguus]|uniref:uncharacterized protein n=1 Tax=Aspergillus ambiguus TaxID=176160 RepID=UPI003CCDB2B4
MRTGWLDPRRLDKRYVSKTGRSNVAVTVFPCALEVISGGLTLLARPRGLVGLYWDKGRTGSLVTSRISLDVSF